MTALKLAYFLSMLLGTLAAIWKYVIMDPAISAEPSCRRLRAGLPLLGAFMGVNLLGEFLVYFFIAPLAYNHFIYTIGACLSAVLMLLFYSLLAPGRWMRYYAALSISYVLYFFISHSVWQPETVVSRAAILGYFGIMMLGSIIFAISCRRGFWGLMRRRVLILASIASAYYALACVTLYLQTSSLGYNSLEDQAASAASYSVALLFYGGILFIVMRIPDKPEPEPLLNERRAHQRSHF